MNLLSPWNGGRRLAWGLPSFPAMASVFAKTPQVFFVPGVHFAWVAGSQKALLLWRVPASISGLEDNCEPQNQALMEVIPLSRVLQQSWNTALGNKLPKKKTGEEF